MPGPSALADTASRLRRTILRTALNAQKGHVPPAFSWVEIAVALFHGGVLRLDPHHPRWPERNRFVLSKGHGCLTLCAVLADLGFFPEAELERFAADGAMLPGHPDLGGLTAIVDRNGLSATGFTEKINALEPLADRWRSFGWDVAETDGHDIAGLIRLLTPRPPRPLAVIAHTIKGKGVNFMENSELWHHQLPQGDLIAAAWRQLGGH